MLQENKTIKINSEQSIVQAIDVGTPRSAMKWVWIIGLGGIFFEAYAGSALSASLEPLTQDLGLSTVQVAWVTSMYMVVAIFLSPFAGGLADRIGRLKVLLLAKLVAALAMLIGLTAGNFELILFSRFLAGIAWAMDFGVLLAFISEFLPTRHQRKLNRWQGMWYVATTSSLLFTYLIYNFGVGISIWRWLLGSCLVIALFLFFAQRALLVESPRWLASRGRHSEAVDKLQKVYDVSVEAAPDSLPKKSDQSTNRNSGNAFVTLFRPPYLRRTIIANVAWMMQACQYYAIGWYLPVIALTLFGDSFGAATIGAAAFNVLGIIGGFTAASLAGKLRIRGAVQAGFAACSVILLAFGLTFGSAPFALAAALPALFILFHSALASPGGAALSAQAYPSRLRGLGLGVATTSSNIGSAAGLFIFPLLQAGLGTGGAITAMAVVPFIGFVVTSVIRWDPDREGNKGKNDPTEQAELDAVHTHNH